MISTQRIVYCTNPHCTDPVNTYGNRLCANCLTPLTYKYLWAVDTKKINLEPGEKIASRYQVISPQIWLDTQPILIPDISEKIPDKLIPYLRLHNLRSHLPHVYGFVRLPQNNNDNILLLENAPINDKGSLYPAIIDVWEHSTAVRQVYWLWQILELWQPLSELGVAGSLLVPENLRVQGWCVRLLELIENTNTPSLQQLGESWQPIVAISNTKVNNSLKKIVKQMCSGVVDFENISAQLNQLLLSAAAELPLTLKVSGITDKGRQLHANEDNCFPNSNTSKENSILPKVSIVCDGIGGHEGGEVASNLAVQSVKLQIRALLAEVAQQTEIVSPELLKQQIEASLRVVNNLICNANNEQKRQKRERMATTLVMSVQIPQSVQTTGNWRSENACELYLANIGDSRAYWITRDYCQLLTVDDDVATREVSHSRSLYRQALQRPDATALTQALGTKEGEFLHPHIRRLILEEDGILLLCSDGLSDNNLVEHYWRDYALPVLTGEVSTEEAADSWIKLANQKNGHDNISVVITHCRVIPDYLAVVTPKVSEVEVLQTEPELAASSQALLDLRLSDDEPVINTTTVATKKEPKRKHNPILLLAGLLVMLLGFTALGLLGWWLIQPKSFNKACQRLPYSLERFCPPD
ncbi:protein phosphatase 2C domain-containing protein [Plectonema cf. radiosum LEGE 06105]|uniref:Protein phosphatase 2C domain-containing protein n=1 Tax=Plectonema cf. radiosum LEGE 06105 TaxID=945769 RepID=A0A8J7JWR8_9CYAN|nr:protein phosphatase 2C domain-containing protein [Plectonema radiosum]MBE9217124.1 protein phosphatase 2C domain-containing protein [Plectonema cf. radiosum LEGE 06105]